MKRYLVNFLEDMLQLVSIHKLIKALDSFQFRNEQFFARSRKARDCAEAYEYTPHKQTRRLTQILRKRAISGWKPVNAAAMGVITSRLALSSP
jgi:hypothetical protein